MTAHIVALTAAALALSGCYIDLGGGDESPGTAGDWRTPPSTVDDPYAGFGTEIAVDAHSLRGDMGAVTPFDGHIYRTTGLDYDTSASVQINAGDPASRWAVMSLVSIQGGLNHPDLVPGAHFLFTGYPADSSAFFMSTLGCSGEEEGTWTFDIYADQMEVDVTEGDEAGSRRIDFQAQFTNTDWSTGESTRQIVTGSFSYTRP